MRGLLPSSNSSSPLVACFSSNTAYKVHTLAFSGCYTTSFPAAFSLLLESLLQGQSSFHTSRSRTAEVFGFVSNFVPILAQVSAKASIVFALLLAATSLPYGFPILDFHSVSYGALVSKADSQQSRCVAGQSSNTANGQVFSPFAFEYDINPVIHRPYLEESQSVEATGHTHTVSLLPASVAAHHFETIPSVPSTPRASSEILSDYWLDTPATSISASTSPYGSVPDSITQSEGPYFICCLCQDEFSRRCDLKYVARPVIISIIVDSIAVSIPTVYTINALDVRTRAVCKSRLVSRRTFSDTSKQSTVRKGRMPSSVWHTDAWSGSQEKTTC